MLHSYLQLSSLLVALALALCGMNLPVYAADENSAVKAGREALIENGVLNLSAPHASAQNTLKLAGKWLFFWNRYVLPGEVLEDPLLLDQAMRVNVPGSWHNYEDPVSGKKLGSRGYGSYLLQIEGVSARQLLNQEVGLLVADAFVNARIYFFNRHSSHGVIAQNGVPSQNPEGQVPFLIANLTRLSFVGDGPWYLLIHISSFDHMKGGLRSAPLLGGYESLQRQLQLDRMVAFFLIGVMVVVGLWNISLFLQRREDRGSLCLGLFCFVLALRFLLVNHFIEFIFQSPSPLVFEVALKADYLTHVWGMCLFGSFLQRNFGEYISQKVMKTLWLTGAAVTLIVAAKSAYYYSACLLGFQLFVLVPGLYFIFKVALAAKRGVDGARISLAGMLILIIGILHDVMVGNDIIRAAYIQPYTIMLFLVLQSQIVGKRFAVAFYRSKEADRRALEEQKRTATLQEELRYEVESRFWIASNIAHRINNPLNYIQLATKVFESELPGLHRDIKTLFQDSDNDPEGKQVHDYFMSRLSVMQDALLTMKSGLELSTESIREIRAISGVDGANATYYDINKIWKDVKKNLEMGYGLERVRVMPENLTVASQGKTFLDPYALKTIFEEILHYWLGQCQNEDRDKIQSTLTRESAVTRLALDLSGREAEPSKIEQMQRRMNYLLKSSHTSIKMQYAAKLLAIDIEFTQHVAEDAMSTELQDAPPLPSL
jgi:signal transduction histidine kinase